MKYYLKLPTDKRTSSNPADHMGIASPIKPYDMSGWIEVEGPELYPENEKCCSCDMPEPFKMSDGVYCSNCAKPIDYD